MARMVTLQVYVEEGCWSCAESRRIVADMAPQFPEVRIELIDVTNAPRPKAVFAVPTYVLDGRVISLGNPYRHELCRHLQAALDGAAT
jgi:hypothetical protein